MLPLHIFGYFCFLVGGVCLLWQMVVYTIEFCRLPSEEKRKIPVSLVKMMFPLPSKKSDPFIHVRLNAEEVQEVSDLMNRYK